MYVPLRGGLSSNMTQPRFFFFFLYDGESAVGHLDLAHQKIVLSLLSVKMLKCFSGLVRSNVHDIMS